jgi:hypothetical protein
VVRFRAQYRPPPKRSAKAGLLLPGAAGEKGRRRARPRVDPGTLPGRSWPQGQALAAAKQRVPYQADSASEPSVGGHVLLVFCECLREVGASERT